MAVTPASIKAKFPEFTPIPDATIQGFIDDSGFFFPPSIWNIYTQGGASVKDQGQSYWVASMLFTNVVTAAGGQNMFNAAPVSDQSAGQLRQGFAVNAIDASDVDALFESNKYGQMYLAIRNSVVQGISTTATALIDLSPIFSQALI